MISDRLTLVLLVSLAYLAANSCDGEIIKITNNLGTHKDLSLHCKSKDDDLGVHVLMYNGSYQFSFRPNFWGTTLFFCAFWWAPQTSELHWFDVYKEERDSGNSRYWDIVESGPCRKAMTDIGAWTTICYEWNKRMSFDNPY